MAAATPRVTTVVEIVLSAASYPGVGALGKSEAVQAQHHLFPFLKKRSACYDYSDMSSLRGSLAQLESRPYWCTDVL